MIVAGLGFTTRCQAEELSSLVLAIAQAAGVEVTALAVPDFKVGEGELARAAERLAVEVWPVSREALIQAQSRCKSRSATALRTVGVASVAEACALAASGPQARLLVPKTSSARASCALATDEETKAGPEASGP